MIFKFLDSEYEIRTRFDHWNHPKDAIAFVKPERTAIQIAEGNLIKCRQYLLFLSSSYFPVLSACFYVLLHKACSSLTNIDAMLMQYVSQSDWQSRPEQLAFDWKAELRQFDRQEKDLFSQLYQQIHDILSDEQQLQHWQTLTSLNYIFPNSPYQKAILETTLREKFGTHNRNTPKFITFSEDAT